MPRKELSPQIRSRICELKSIGWSYRQIHTRHPEIPLGTIKTTIQREASRLNNESKPRSGAPYKLTEEQRDNLYSQILENPHTTQQDLLASVDNAIKVRSLRKLLYHMGLRKWRQRRRPEIQPHHASQHLEWAHR
ncbi:hypothetical protein I7I53_08120 [Histoplasma capsulatum var. duboisii H88]|uniref:Transposase Tc1-like domain-containing protein n=1 Tax=Ajellomyces capsulatus (strain H88) TaxID=544711 RepID=A0A8A1LHT0_AJEC8|nr:hypothetical protein I7I53_08120 [Histoplasma capsulatum var. duboisii H88]